VHALAVETGDPALMAYACSLIGVTLATRGKRRAAVEWLEKGIAVCEKHGDTLERPLFLVDAEVAMRSNIAPALTLLGLADQAREHLRKAVARADRIRQPLARMLAHWVGCITSRLIDDTAAMEAHCTKLTEVVAASGLRQGVGPSLWIRGLLETLREQPEMGYAHIMEGYSAHESLGMYAGLPSVLGFAAESLLAMGRVAEAEAKVDEALALAERTDERVAYALILLAKARIVAHKGDAAVRSVLEQALEETRAEPAPGVELQVWTAIAAGPERTEQELNALADAYERVTEGRDSPVAARARAVLATRGGPPVKPDKRPAR
jgi:tetratricopeptide (TPR) repeat protein